MGAIGVQCAVGATGKKALTKLSNCDFNSMAVINGVPLGANSSGLFKLNDGELESSAAFTRTFILATTDFGIDNQKRVRFVYIGIDTEYEFTLSVKADDQTWRDYTVTPPKTGLQRIRISIGRSGQGRYWTFKISSTNAFVIDKIEAILNARSGGIVGY